MRYLIIQKPLTTNYTMENQNKLINFLNTLAENYGKGFMAETVFVWRAMGACEFARSMGVIESHVEKGLWEQARNIAWHREKWFSIPEFQEDKREVSEDIGNWDVCGNDRTNYHDCE